VKDSNHMSWRTDFDLFSSGFKSPVARDVFQLSLLGCLAGLGFVPGWERLFGFSGFFGFIGVAFIVEFVHRVKTRNGQGT
jgi:hypothetical protein